MKVCIVALCLVAAALADNPPPRQSYQPEPQYPAAPAQYSYEWAVKDDYSGNNYGQNEERNGDKTSGSYYVALPDGRLQRVVYTVDAYGGYQAEVTYEGEAQYPAAPQKNSYAPAPAPKPAPSYNNYF